MNTKEFNNFFLNDSPVDYLTKFRKLKKLKLHGTRSKQNCYTDTIADTCIWIKFISIPVLKLYYPPLVIQKCKQFSNQKLISLSLQFIYKIT